VLSPARQDPAKQPRAQAQRQRENNLPNLRSIPINFRAPRIDDVRSGLELQSRGRDSSIDLVPSWHADPKKLYAQHVAAFTRGENAVSPGLADEVFSTYPVSYDRLRTGISTGQGTSSFPIDGGARRLALCHLMTRYGRTVCSNSRGSPHSRRCERARRGTAGSPACHRWPLAAASGRVSPQPAGSS
jgi:hypothetical protein